MPSYSGGMFQDPTLPAPTPAPKVETKLDLDDDFGFTTVSATEEKNTAEIDILGQRVTKYHNEVTKFFDKLAANPEKDIHWPNRDVKIAEFKNKLERILKGEE